MQKPMTFELGKLVTATRFFRVGPHGHVINAQKLKIGNACAGIIERNVRMAPKHQPQRAAACAELRICRVILCIREENF